MMNALGRHTTIRSEHMNTMMEMQTDSNKHVTVEAKKLYRNIVPDVTGMGLKDAIYILENNGLQVEVTGKGRVRQQSLAPGTRIYKGQNITLQLS